MLLKNENETASTVERQRIMLVDNDQDMQSFLNLTLEQEGFDTIIAADTEAATSLLDTVKPDLVILDTLSPDQDNLELLDKMRKCSRVPIIMLSADAEAQRMRDALSHGADDYIRMPFSVKPFIARIRAKLRRKINLDNQL